MLFLCYLFVYHFVFILQVYGIFATISVSRVSYHISCHRVCCLLKYLKEISAKEAAEMLEEDCDFVQRIYDLLEEYPEKCDEEIYQCMKKE